MIQRPVSSLIARRSALLDAYRGRDRCYCGDIVGHAGWLICLGDEEKIPQQRASTEIPTPVHKHPYDEEYWEWFPTQQ